VRLNYPNGDMVGHTGNMQAVVRSLEAVDQALERLVQGVLMREGICIVAADHGNCEEMAERDRRTGELLRDADGSLKARTSHTRNPVPCYITGGGAGERYAWDPERTDTSIASLAATVLNLLGYREPLDYLPAVVRPL
jgi:2,3-bisphosphoglycerate-independent phosphoglycerate mutase